MKPKTMVFFNCMEDKTDEVKTAFREYAREAGGRFEAFVVPYTNRFIVLLDDPKPAWGKDRLAQTLRPFIKDGLDFLELEPVAER